MVLREAPHLLRQEGGRRQLADGDGGVCVGWASGVRPRHDGDAGDSEAINRLVGRSTLLGDKGYRGGESSVPTLLVVEDETPRDLRVQRTLVECFFGRLKNKYKAFGRK